MNIVTLFSRSSDNENENNYSINASMIQITHKTQTKCLCYFNDKWKDIYNWIRNVSNQNRSYCTLCRKKLGIAHGGKEYMKAHVEIESHKFRMRQASTSKSIKSQCVGTSLAAQWLRIRLPMQGTQVRATVREDPTCGGATKPARHNY